MTQVNSELKEPKEADVYIGNYKVDRSEKIDPHKELREKLSKGISESWQNMSRDN